MIRQFGIPFLFLALLAMMAMAARVGIDNQAMFEALDSDGSFAAMLVSQNYLHGDLSPRGFYNYGYVTHTLALGLVWLMRALQESIDYVHVTFALKWVSMISFIAAIILMTSMLARLTDRRGDGLNAAIALLFCFTPGFFYWGWHIHPDVVQIPFLCAAILMVFSRTRHATLWSGFFFGVAFGAKYSAVFVAPFFVFYLASSLFPAPKRLLRELFYWSAAALCGWLIFNPTVPFNFAEFRADIAYESAHVAYGHGMRADVSGWRWWEVIRPELGLLALSLPAFLLCIPRALRGGQPFDRAALAAFLALLIGAVYFFIFVHYRNDRYLFQFYPLLAILLAYEMSYALEKASPATVRGVAHIALLLAALSVMRALPSLAMEVASIRQNPRLVAGEAMPNLVPAHAHIAAGAYAYIPDAYADNTRILWVFDAETLSRADILIFNDSVPGRHLWPQAPLGSDAPVLNVGNFDDSPAQAALLRPVFEQRGWRMIYQSPTEEGKAPSVIMFEKSRQP